MQSGPCVLLVRGDSVAPPVACRARVGVPIALVRAQKGGRVQFGCFRQALNGGHHAEASRPMPHISKRPRLPLDFSKVGWGLLLASKGKADAAGAGPHTGRT